MAPGVRGQRCGAFGLQILAASTKVSSNLLDMARDRVERFEAQKARILAKMERVEDNMLGRD